MRVIDGLIGIGWIAFWIYWFVTAARANESRGGVRRWAGSRVAVVLILAVMLRAGVFGKHTANHSRTVALVGLAVWAVGLLVAIWARVNIGRNWGMPMTQRINPELVTTGPYAYIRHPIYTGIILGMVGTAIATSVYALIPVLILGGYFVYSAHMEERYLASQFPESYPRYQRETKMLVPFIY